MAPIPAGGCQHRPYEGRAGVLPGTYGTGHLCQRAVISHQEDRIAHGSDATHSSRATAGASVKLGACCLPETGLPPTSTCGGTRQLASVRAVVRNSDRGAREPPFLWRPRLFAGQDADRPDLGILRVRELRAGRTADAAVRSSAGVAQQDRAAAVFAAGRTSKVLCPASGTFGSGQAASVAAAWRYDGPRRPGRSSPGCAPGAADRGSATWLPAGVPAGGHAARWAQRPHPPHPAQ